MNAYTKFHAESLIRKWHDSKCMAQNTVHDSILQWSENDWVASPQEHAISAFLFFCNNSYVKSNRVALSIYDIYKRLSTFLVVFIWAIRLTWKTLRGTKMTFLTNFTKVRHVKFGNLNTLTRSETKRSPSAPCFRPWSMLVCLSGNQHKKLRQV